MLNKCKVSLALQATSFVIHWFFNLKIDFTNSSSDIKPPASMRWLQEACHEIQAAEKLIVGQFGVETVNSFMSKKQISKGDLILNLLGIGRNIINYCGETQEWCLT